MDRRVRLTGIVNGEIFNIEVSLDTFEKITRRAIRMDKRRFFCTSKIFSNLIETGRSINEKTVIQYLEESEKVKTYA